MLKFIYRLIKCAPLTWSELDGNFRQIADQAVIKEDLSAPTGSSMIGYPPASNVKEALDQVISDGQTIEGRVDHAILSYPNYSSAKTAADNLPNGQRIEAEVDETRSGRRSVYEVQDNDLSFMWYADTPPLSTSGSLFSRRVMDPYFNNDSGGDQIFPNATRAVQGLVILDTPAGTKLFMISRPTGTTNAADERCRIVEYDYSVSDGQSMPVQFTDELAVGHGEALGGYVASDGQVWLYTSQSNADGVFVGVNARKGFSRIRYMGAATTQSDVTSYQLFGVAGSSHDLAEYSNGTVGLSEDGRTILLVASSSVERDSNTFFSYDRAEVEAAPNTLAVRPLSRFILKLSTGEGMGVVGVAADESAIYTVNGTAPFSRHSISCFDWFGSFLKEVAMDDARGEYTDAELLGSSGNVPVAFELEGACLYSGKLHFVCLETWRNAGSVVSFSYNGGLNQNFAAILNSTGVYPYDRTTWVPTTLPASGPFNATTPNVRGNTLTRYRKLVYAVSAVQDAGYKTINGRFKNRTSPTQFPTGRNSFNAYTYNYPDGPLRFLGWNENTRDYKRTMEYTTDGYLRLWDTSPNAEYNMWGSVRARYRDGFRQASIHSGAGDEPTGARSVWHGGTDVEFPGGLRDFTAANPNIAVRETTANGQTTLRNTVTGAVPLILNHVGGNNEIQKWQISGVTRGSIYSSASNFQVAAKNGADLCLSTAPDDGTTISIRWRVQASSSGDLLPGADNARSIGSSTLRPANVYGTNIRPGSGTAIWTSGNGSPEGFVVASIGSMYTRTDATGASDVLYVKASGSGNTGWIAK